MWNKLARPAGFEPATTSLEGWGSVQLSYGRAPVEPKNLSLLEAN